MASASATRSTRPSGCRILALTLVRVQGPFGSKLFSRSFGSSSCGATGPCRKGFTPGPRALRRNRRWRAAPGEQLPEPVHARHLLCVVCESPLPYQRQERPRFPRHFYWCRRCGRRLQPRRGALVAGAATGPLIASRAISPPVGPRVAVSLASERAAEALASAAAGASGTAGVAPARTVAVEEARPDASGVTRAWHGHSLPRNGCPTSHVAVMQLAHVRPLSLGGDVATPAQHGQSAVLHLRDRGAASRWTATRRAVTIEPWRSSWRRSTSSCGRRASSSTTEASGSWLSVAGAA